MEQYYAVKAALHAHCKARIDDRIARIERQLASIRESRDNETKSTAGDKHETGRAMMQIEERNAQAQLAEALRERSAFATIDPDQHSDRIAPGSLVQTDRGVFYLALGLGKVQLDEGLFYCISPKAPIASVLLGKEAGTSCMFNGRSMQIEAVW